MITLAEVVRFDDTDPERLHAVVIADPADDGAFAYPDHGPDGLWVKRLPVRVTIEALT